MEITNIPLGKRSRYEVAKGNYLRWRNKSTTSKIYMATMFAMCKGVCPVCGVSMILAFDNKNCNLPYCATLDHTIPLSYTKEHHLYGLEIMCKKCNGEKGSRIK